jgi:hypothetical protein
VRRVGVRLEAAGGTVRVMPWLAKGLLVLVKTRTGRKLLFATTIGVLELARSEEARKLYAKATHAVQSRNPW